MVLDKNTSPYYDDFEEAKKFLQILFRPSYPVQARELSQAQSILQNQIGRFGRHVFKEGSMVIPGEIGVDLNVPYVKLDPQFNSADISATNFKENKVIGTTSGAIGYILDATNEGSGNPHTLFVKYETGNANLAFTGNTTNSSNTITNINVNAQAVFVVGANISGTGIPSNTFVESITSSTEIVISNSATETGSAADLSHKTAGSFIEGETLVTEDGTYSATVSDSLTDPVGLGSRVKIQAGVYFAKGYFIIVSEQSLILDAYDTKPSYNVGLRIVDSFVTDADDVTLVDPAAGSYNFNAPGAHRYKIDLVLSKFSNTVPAESENFIELMTLSNGSIQKRVTRPDYAELEKTLARRTNDESGSYTVKNFPIQIREHLDTGTNFGVFSSSDGGDSSKLALSIEPGKAYVQGYEIESSTTNIIAVDKARTTQTENNSTIPFTLGNYVRVNNVSGSFNISTYETVELIDVDKDDGSYPNGVIGTAKVRGMEFVSGVPSTATAQYKLFLFDIRMDSDSNGDSYQFSEVKSISNADQSKDVDTILNSAGDAELKDSGVNNSAMVLLPSQAIQSLSDVNYTVKRFNSGTMTGSALTLSLSTNESFSAYNVSNYHVAIRTLSSTASTNGYSVGDVIDLSANGATVTLGGSPIGRQVTFDIPDISGSTIDIISTVSKASVSEKTKTLTTRQQTVSFASEIYLDRADIFDIVSILDADDGDKDITDRFVLDNGQRDNFYDCGKITYRSNFKVPTGNIKINYRFFVHGTGDYFSVNSYDGVIAYEDIQTFVSPSTGAKYDLRNTADFRPRVNNTRTGFLVFSEIVANAENFVSDYAYYLPRIDKVIIDTRGNFTVSRGIPSKTPLSPKAPNNTMTLYEIGIPAYTHDVKDIAIVPIDNRRYTMHDIGRLEKRIENLEYYSSLNLLEKDTADLFIDDGAGGNRFKSGFLVDNFTSHLIGDSRLPEYTCAIDKEMGYLRAPFVSTSVPLDINVTDSSNYQKTGDLITLPYTSKVLVAQPFASKTENINPYDVFSWVGTVALTPQTDEWYEEQQAPDRLIQNDDGLADSLAALNGQVIWNDWETNWLGAPLTATNVSSRILAVEGNGRAVRFVSEVTQLVSREQGQTRTGVRLNVTETTNTRSEGDRVIATDVIPWIRSRQVEFNSKALKPNTQVYPFFDNVNVTDYCSPTGGAFGDSLITDNSGEVSGTFNIPNNDTLRFRTGERVFKLTDSETNDRNFATTSSESIYTAKGILETKQETIISTRSARVVNTTVAGSRVIIGQNLQNVVVRSGWFDPLAQTFLIEQEGGVFLNKIDIFFATKDTSGVPVRLEIRNVVNGYPGQFVLPFSEVSLKPEDVNISTDSTAATTFTFESPVYLQDNQEYCFVLLANSIEYNIWTSRIGEFDVKTGARISEQPYAGVLFKSQNASTWSADQEQDIKFNIHRCVFDTAVQGNVQFRNKDLTTSFLPANALSTTDASDIVGVYSPNHGLIEDDEVTISGLTANVNGIPFAELNATHVITYVDHDNFSIVVTTDANLTGDGDSSGARMNKNLRVDVANCVMETITLPQTAMGWGLKVRDSENSLHSNYIPIEVKSNVEFTDERFIFNTDNESASKSVHVLSQFASDNDAISPVIDTQRSSIIAISNRINNTATDELLPSSGDALSRYITKKISLTTPAISIRTYFAAVRPPSSEIKVYVKYMKDSDSGVVFDDLPYVELNKIVYPQGSETAFRDYVFELEDIEPFSTYAIKIVMVSEETSDVPLIKDFRTIALGT